MLAPLDVLAARLSGHYPVKQRGPQPEAGIALQPMDQPASAAGAAAHCHYAPAKSRDCRNERRFVFKGLTGIAPPLGHLPGEG